MKLQKITAIFLAVVLVTGAITLGTSFLVDDAFASEDKYKKKSHDRGYDSYDKDDRNKKHNIYNLEYPKDKNIVIVLNNTLYNNYESIEYPTEYTDDKNSYETTEYPTEYTEDKNSNDTNEYTTE